ncbi:UvrD-helicase domain-containing protein [Microbulbifer spongiae]|uniref:DNA 3'-5' helicase n=1 Tax=Microbulbifer spongiae TaxID=2944933 RepID=A0ABY9EEI2_9GAMM|nr:UvrD-helicase domain-containing protein [Microbulbifer sp. MI-G]WKD51433.1 UvrD-helicase domain-containing protein [Microbulbifer sp. MI-G]
MNDTATAQTQSPIDAKARNRALDITGSFAVSAPAGSGKTGLLTQRILKLLATCQQPEEVLAITFTRKAAGEMRARLLEALHCAHHNPRPAGAHEAATWDLARTLLERDRERNWQLLQTPQRLRIQTIDGLCRSLASQLPIESGLGAPGEPLEHTRIPFELAVVNLLKHLDGDQPDRDLQQLLLHLDNDLGQLNKLLRLLLEKREQWLGPLLSVRHEDAQDYFHFVIDELVAERLGSLQCALGCYTGELLELARYAAHNLQRDNPAHPLCDCAELTALPATTSSGLHSWLALGGLLLTASGDLRKIGGINRKLGFGLPGKRDPTRALAEEYKQRMQALLTEMADNTPLHAALREMGKLPSGLQQRQWQLLQALARILPKLVAELKLVFQQLGTTDYAEVAQAALTALGNSEAPTDLALKLDLKTRHILVDEFQDTAQIQLQLLEKLTAGWEPGDGRTLFIVGDGAQSCYGFRNANVGIFLNARAQGIGEVALEALDLQVNFRSEDALVHWVNEVFAKAFPQADNIGRGAVRYRVSRAFKGTEWTGPAVNVYGCIDDRARTSEAVHTAELVQRLQGRDPQGRIAILVRRKSHLQQILPALSAAGIPFQAPELAPLASKMVILDLLSLTRALLDPSDRTSWLAVLRAPWCGLQLPDLFTLANWGNGDIAATDSSARPLLLALGEADQIPLLSEEGRARLAQVARKLLQAWEQRSRKPLRNWIEGLWLALGGPASVAHKRDLDNVQDFLQLLERFDSGGTISDWLQFTHALDTLYARPARDARLQVMTIHKSKGLEFEHVLIPGLDRCDRPGSGQLLRWTEWLSHSGESRFLLAPNNARGDTDPLYEYLKYDNSERERLEGTRLLYVGCTRAIRSLHLFACVSRDEKKGTLQAPGGDALLASIWPSVIQNRESRWCHWLETQPAPESESPINQNHNYLLRMPARWQPQPIPQQHWLAQYRMRDYQPGEHGEDNIPQLGQVAQRWLRHAGTVAHETLATIAQTDIARWNEARLVQQRTLWRLRLSQLGLCGSNLDLAAEKVEVAVRNSLNCPTGRWLLDSTSVQEAASELELHSGGRHLRRAFVDRTFIDAHGVRWIVDYKTAEPGTGEDRAAFIAAQLEHYRPQLETYRTLFYARGERNIRCALYFPLLPQLAELG